MSIVEAIVLAIIQGVTEFLPVSSSAHLIMIPWWLGWDRPPVIFEVTVHIGTILAVIAYFWSDWLQLIKAGWAAVQKRAITTAEERIFFFILISSIPAGIGGLLFKDYLENQLSEITIVCVTLMMTAGLLALSEWLTNKQTGKPLEEIGLWDAIWIGLAQAFALIPAISRSGSTISAGLLRGLNRDAATRYSFLMSTPIILGAGAVQVLDVLRGEVKVDGQEVPLLVGFVISGVVGYFSITFLLNFVRQRSFYVFAAYCMAFSIVTLMAVALQG